MSSEKRSASLKKVNYKDLLFVPQYVADIIEGINYRKDVKNRICNFLRGLMTDSKRQFDDKNIHCYVVRDRGFLRKSLGGSYTKHLLPLLESGIIDRTGYINSNISKNTKARKYRINPYNINVNEGSSIGTICSSIEDIVFISDTLLDEALPLLGLTGIEYLSKRSEKEPKRHYKIFTSALDKIDIGYEEIFQKSKDSLAKINISNLTLGNNIKEGVYKVFIKGKEEPKYLKKEQAENIAKSLGLTFFLDKRKCLITDVEEYLKQKRYHKIISDVTSLVSLKEGYYRANRNTTNNRLDTNFTNMSSDLLSVIKEQNNLVEIDLCNSQIAISTLIIDLDTEDYTKYKELALGCEFYEELQEELSLKDRGEAKTICFEIMFSSPSNRSENVKKFKEVFPYVGHWIDCYKEDKGSNQFAIALQKKESEIFIDNIFETLLKRGIFALTLHDSLIVRREDEGLVRSIVQEYFDEINFKVMLR